MTIKDPQFLPYCYESLSLVPNYSWSILLTKFQVDREKMAMEFFNNPQFLGLVSNFGQQTFSSLLN